MGADQQLGQRRQARRTPDQRALRDTRLVARLEARLPEAPLRDPADGWFEWTGPKNKRQPHWIHRPDAEPFLFAGLYERWTPRDGGDDATPITTFTIITTDANEQLASIHNRMPVVLPNDRLEAWLDPRVSDLEQLQPLLTSAPDDAFISVAVSPRVNSVRNDNPELLAPQEQLSF